MAIKKYLSLDGLSEYDALIKEEISSAVSNKANSSHTHTISNITNLQTTLDGINTEIDTINEEIDGSIKSLSVSGKTITYTKNDGSTGTITTQDTNTDTKVTNTLNTTTKAYITGTTSATTNTGTQIFDTGVYLDTTAGQLTATTFKGSLSGNASSATKATQDGSGNTITSTYETKSDASAKLTEAKTYADSAASSAATQVKNDLLNGAGGAYDTLKELGDLIETNVDAIEALEAVASEKADKNHTHNYAGSSSAGGAATSANKVNSSLTVKLNGGTTEGTNQFTFNGSAAKSVNITPSAIGAATSSHTHDDRYYTETEIDTKLSGKANTSHGNHVPATQTASNKVFLRNDNTWATITPANIGAAASSHTHTVANISDLTATVTELNYMSGVASSVQTQIDGKANSSHSHSDATTSAAGFMSAGDKTKLNGIATGANKTIVDSSLSTSSTNPVQNKIVATALNNATSAISTNLNSINAHSTAISNLQTAVAEIQEITSAEIQALFA